MRHNKRLFFLICIIIILLIAAALNATVIFSPFKGMSESLEISISNLGHECPQTRQNAAAAIKDMNVTDDRLLIAWAKLRRLLTAIGGRDDFDRLNRSRDAIFCFIDLDVAFGRLATFTG